jgi:hypothetical protein
LTGVTIDQSTMITPRALSEWERWKSAVDRNRTVHTSSDDTIVQDTVGAVACTIDGDVSAGVSRSVIYSPPGLRRYSLFLQWWNPPQAFWANWRGCPSLTSRMASDSQYVQAGTFGAGCWASGAHGNLNAVACSISGKLLCSSL